MRGEIRMSKIPDGLVLFYCKDGELYPIAMSQEQLDMLQFLCKVFEPIKVIKKPQGQAVDLRS
jgi:hypothetical protein